ncbi:MAG: NYN domain-containing protein [Candidatus Didemnitutus sp.]|nr:NYN domain-containing protein [Candidatus Didemnitutus sp.]
MSAPTPAPQRVIAYVDGFNLFFGLKSKGWKQFYWLDVHRAALALLRSGQRLVEVKYFTSRVSSAHGDPAQARRQAIYLEALATLPSVSLYFGHYLSKAVRCHACGAQWQKHDEKMTDVNIATELLVDAFEDRFDTALLVSAESDLAGPILRLRALFPGKRVVVVFPPDRASKRLEQIASATLHVGRGVLAGAQLPDEVIKPSGFALQRPESWR